MTDLKFGYCNLELDKNISLQVFQPGIVAEKIFR